MNLETLKKNFPLTDSNGNQIKIVRETIYLDLVGNDLRDIGVLGTNKKDEIVYSKGLEKSKHVMRINDSIGFNVKLLEALPPKTICRVVLDGSTTYLARVEHILTVGGYLHFKQQGFEKQIFLPRNSFQKVVEHE